MVQLTTYRRDESQKGSNNQRQLAPRLFEESIVLSGYLIAGQ